MDIEELRTFVEDTSAARLLFLVKAIASRHLIRLEADFGLQMLG